MREIRCCGLLLLVGVLAEEEWFGSNGEEV